MKNDVAKLANVSRGCLLAFAGLVLVLHLLRPEYDPRVRFMSEFAVGRYSWLMTLAFLSLAAGAGALARAFRVQDRMDGKSWWGPSIYWLCMIDLLVVAIFPSDLSGSPHRTWVGVVHDWASTPPFAMILVSMPLLVQRFSGHSIGMALRLPALLLGGAALLVRVLTLIPGALPWTGWTQRLLVSVVLIWLLLVTSALAKRTSARLTTSLGSD